MPEYFPEDEPASINEEAEIERFDREVDERKRSESLYYKGILHGLILGIFGNLLVSVLIETIRSIIPLDYWLPINLVLLVATVIIVYFVSHHLLNKVKKPF
jgi:hypothetical protein